MTTVVIQELKPQLASEVEAGQVKRLLNDPDWVMQEKMDGKRILIHRRQDWRGGEIVAENRSGKDVTDSLPECLMYHLVMECSGSWVADGELIGGVFWCFDFLGELADLCTEPLWFRHAAIHSDFLKVDSLLQVVPLLEGSEKKLAFTRILKSGGEGVVFKKKESDYRGGRSKAWLKCKFTASASLVVLSSNKGRRSVSVGSWDAGKSSSVGNVTIPGTTRVPQPGEIVEVQYLYATNAGKLFQPVYLMQREDLSLSDCSRRQLKLKQGATPQTL